MIEEVKSYHSRLLEVEKFAAYGRKQIATLTRALENNIELVQQNNTLINQLGQLLQAKSAVHRPKACLPDVEKFSGATYTFETWLPSIEAKLRIDGAAIGDLEAQFWYLFSRLDGKIQALVMPQVQQVSETLIFNPQDLLDQLDRIYDDPHKVQQAENALYACHQGKEEGFGLFMVKFERLLYKAKANLWTEPAKISLIRQALNKETSKRAQ